MNILITGGTGFIGRPLCISLLAQQHTLCVLTRDRKKAERRLPFPGIRFIESLSLLKPEDCFEEVINLAGAPIAKPWTASYQALLQKSRIALTQELVQTLKRLRKPPSHLFSGSAIGYYGPQDRILLSETAPPVPSFSHTLCQAWEQAAGEAVALGIKLCCLRTGIVLGQGGGALASMRFPFSLGLGGKIGTGTQGMSWIHLEDVIRLIHFCRTQAIEGPVNVTAPEPVAQQDFAKIYGGILHRPTFLPMPAWLLRSLMGQMAEELLITGQWVIPAKVEALGFQFLYPRLEEALQAIESPSPQH